MKKIIIVVCVSLAISALAKPTVDDGVISSVYSLEDLLTESRLQYLPISPPTSAPYVDRLKNVLPVDWKAFKNKAFTRQMYAEMDSNGFPVYRVGVQQEFSGEIVFRNAFGIEVLRLPAPKGFNVYAWAENYFQLPASTLSEMQRAWYLSSKIQLEVFLLPEIFFPAYQEIEAELAAQDGLMGSMMMSMAASSSGAVPISVDVVPGSNGTIELQIDTAGTVVRHIEIFSRKDLVYPPGWSLTVNNLNATNGMPVIWSDPTTNEMFYYVNDSDNDGDGDGYSDLRERLDSLTLTNSFDYLDYDGDGLQDWFEIRFWGSITAYDEMDDPDNDNLVNGIEMVYSISPSMTNVIFYSDPALPDSDFDGLRDDFERLNWHTDPMNPDSDFDGRTDAAEVLGSPATDPNNPDTISPSVAFL